MNLLDDKQLIENLDQSNQLSWIQNWGLMFNQGFDTGSSFKIPKKIHIGKKGLSLDYSQKFSSIVVFGMGGSAISGDYLSSLLFRQENFQTPIHVIRGYHIPKWVSTSTLVIAVSYSGNTRETLTCLHSALQVNSSPILVSSGGVIKEVAEKYSIPWIKLPEGLQPRAAFPVIFGSIFGLFDNLFPKLSLSTQMKNVGNVINDIISQFGPNRPYDKNLAKQLATKLQNKIPIIISSELALITRWKCQFNENSKMVAYMDVFPELMHNTIQGWEHENLTFLEFIVIKLGTDSNEIVDKVKFCLNIANDKIHKTIQFLEFNNGNSLENLMAATLFGDLLSLYLAFLQSLDPSKIRLIVEMKKEFEPILQKNFDVKSNLLDL